MIWYEAEFGGNEMTIEVRYQSRGGNTKAVAEIIADVAKTRAKSITEPLQTYTDILFVGGELRLCSGIC